jgi:hypothetical protein
MGNFVTPMPYTRLIHTATPILMTGTNWQSWETGHSGPMSAAGTHLATSPGSQSAFSQKAITQALARAKNQQVNLAMAIVTARQSIVLIKESASAIVDIMQAVMRRDVPGVVRAAGGRSHSKARVQSAMEQLFERRNVSTKFLATVFGVFPLLKDIEGGVNMLADNGSVLEFVVKGSAGVNKTRVASTFTPWITWSYGPGIPIPNYGPMIETTTHESMSSRAFLRYAIDLPALQRAAQLGFTNPALLAWDALPFSFVLDWAVNVSQYLTALDSSFGLRYVSGCVSERRVQESTFNVAPYTLTGTHPSGQAVTLVKATYTPGMKRTVNFKRVVLLNQPSPSLHFKNPLSVFSALATAALLSNAFKTKRDFRKFERQFRYRPRKSKYLPPIKYRP